MQRSKRMPRGMLVESLETRTLLAGDVAVSVVDGSLLVQGDAESNQVHIRSGQNPGEFVVAGIPGSNTTVNGQEGPALFTGVLRHVVAGLGEGDDSIIVDEARIRGGLFVRTGIGNDHVVVGRPDEVPASTDGDPPSVVIGGAMTIITGPGEDTVAGAELAVARAANIRTGLGDDSVRLGRAVPEDSTGMGDPQKSVVVGGALRIDLGQGNDTLGLNQVGVQGHLFARGGRGDDQLAINDTNVRRALLMTTGSGDDTVGINHSSAARAEISAGLGNDHAAINDSSFATVFAQMGAGDDVLAMKDTNVARLAVLNGGRGNDTFVNLGGNEFGARRLFGFELPTPDDSDTGPSVV